MAHIQFTQKVPETDKPAIVDCYEDGDFTTIKSYDVGSDPMKVDCDVKGWDSEGAESTVNKVVEYLQADWTGVVEVA